MEEDKIIGIPLGIIMLGVFLYLLFSLLFYTFKKGVLHFRLLKELYPQELKEVHSYLGMMWFSNILMLRFDVMVWFWTPIYYSKISINNLKGKAHQYHDELIRINKKIATYFSLYLLLMAFVGLVAYLL